MSKRQWLGRASLTGMAAWMICLGLGGCGNSPSVFSNSDPYLKGKEMTYFASDAGRRTYPADAPKGEAKEAPARAQVRYKPWNEVGIVNLSATDDYKDVEIWVNQKYVIFLPRMEKKAPEPKYTRIDFKMIYDRTGKFFETSDEQPRISKLEMFTGGKLYQVPIEIE